ncbi:endoprotease aex-5-like isoform X1 [Mya arenaria]|uniref:endoprotease aex-5-like isoform X1 n=1 Tax=Mya arenaria TaxID=6604 RepID=UPI0022DF8EC6|nr:endoprotease aex-5-like isoform X1 [Mya arenaria]
MAHCGHPKMARVNIILTFTFLFLVVETAQGTEYEKIRIVIRSKEMYLNGIRQSLGKYFFSFDSKINDNLFIFVKESEITKHRLLSSDLQKLRRSNRHIEKLVQSYRMYPASDFNPQSAANDIDEQQADQWNASNIMLLCPPYFDQALGIDDSWIKHNVSGRGIVVGVTDVGINANNAFIRESINSDLSYNFVENIPQTGYTSLPDKNGSLLTTGHAIACAGLIARPKTGDKCVPCGLGVAHGAKVADLQIAKSGERTWLTQGIDSAIFLRALAFRRDAIPIFSNSWATPRALRKSDFYEEEVLTQGIREVLITIWKVLFHLILNLHSIS